MSLSSNNYRVYCVIQIVKSVDLKGLVSCEDLIANPAMARSKLSRNIGLETDYFHEIALGRLSFMCTVSLE